MLPRGLPLGRAPRVLPGRWLAPALAQCLHGALGPFSRVWTLRWTGPTSPSSAPFCASSHAGAWALNSWAQHQRPSLRSFPALWQPVSAHSAPPPLGAHWLAKGCQPLASPEPRCLFVCLFNQSAFKKSEPTFFFFNHEIKKKSRYPSCLEKSDQWQL